MGQPIELTRLERSASDFRGLAAKTGDGGWVRRLLAIALQLDGHSREAAAEANGMTRQTLRDWVHRFNADGVTGLRSRTSPGRPPALNETRMEELKSIVLEGPDPERHRVVRWRRIDLREEIAYTRRTTGRTNGYPDRADNPDRIVARAVARVRPFSIPFADRH